MKLEKLGGRVVLCGILLLGFFSVSYAQSLDTSTHVFPKWTIKFAPLSLANFFKNSADFGFDHRLSKDCLVDLELGYVFHSPILVANSAESYKGIRIRPGMKWKHKLGTVGFHLRYEHIVHDERKVVRRYGDTFRQVLASQRRLNIFGGEIRLTDFIFFGKKRGGVFEQFVALGLQMTNVRRLGVPDDAEFENDELRFYLDEGFSVNTSLHLGFNIGLCKW